MTYARLGFGNDADEMAVESTNSDDESTSSAEIVAVPLISSLEKICSFEMAIKNNLPFYTKEKLMLAVELTRNRLALKNIHSFNCFVTQDEELENLLFKIRHHLAYFSDNTNFQVIHRIGGHWLTLHFHITNGKVDVFIFDAVFENRVPMIFHLLQSHFPNLRILFASGIIQSDENSCPIFAFDSACQLALIPNLHEKLNQLEGIEFEQKGLIIKFIPVFEFTNEFGPLFRNTQSFKKINQFLHFHPNLKGNKHLLFKDYLNQKDRTFVNDGKSYNVAIEIKRNRLYEKILDFYRGLNNHEYERIKKNNAEFSLLDKFIENRPRKLKSIIRPINPVSINTMQDVYAYFRFIETLACHYHLHHFNIIEFIKTANISMTTCSYLTNSAFKTIYKKIMEYVNLFNQIHHSHGHLSPEAIVDIVNAKFENIILDEEMDIDDEEGSDIKLLKLIKFASIPLHKLSDHFSYYQIESLISEELSQFEEILEKNELPLEEFMEISQWKRISILKEADNFEEILLNMDWHTLTNLEDDQFIHVLKNPEMVAMDFKQSYHFRF